MLCFKLYDQHTRIIIIYVCIYIMNECILVVFILIKNQPSFLQKSTGLSNEIRAVQHLLINLGNYIHTINMCV